MNMYKPYCAAMAVVFIWSGWITISRFGVHTALQPADITLLRYWTALLVTIPFILRYSWQKSRLWQYLVVGLGVGFPYTMLSFYALRHLQAAHAGVLVNGLLPVLGTFAVWLLFRQRITAPRYAAIGVIFLSNICMTNGTALSLHQAGGLLLLLAAAVCYTCHMVAIRFYKMTWRDVIVIVPVVNVILFTPLWFVFRSGFVESTYHDMAVQALYQGVVVNVLALFCVAYAIEHIGTVTVSLFMSFVPVVTALLAWIMLGETLSPLEMIGIAGCSIGLTWYALSPAQVTSGT
ncbi:DMT family transporter [Desulfobulbus oligotrophicus]|uniref:DMT family transporter n=2 Tax=Desulfobulbus oligotrophicus TaxID=1909699 RepID=A0A7T6AR11_9BACT|nr:DMT family transporter [Desulfobulbus oligotrophicus]